MSQSYFEKYLEIAPFALALWRAVEANSLETARREFGFQRPILDVGCGFGEFSGVFFESTIEVGIDISHDDLLKAARHNRYDNLYVQDAKNLDFADETFATAVSISVLEHIPGAEKAIQEIYRVLKPGGLLAATMPTSELYNYLLYPALLGSVGFSRMAKGYFRLFNLAFKHENIWTPDEWVNLIKDANFTILKADRMISRRLTRIFDLSLISAFPSQLGRWVTGDRLVWLPELKKKLLRGFVHRQIEREDGTGSNIIIVARKPIQTG